MRCLRFDRLLTGAAIALPLAVVLALPFGTVQASSQPRDEIEAAVPMPGKTALAPPSANDATSTPAVDPSENAAGAPSSAALEPIADAIRAALPKSERTFSSKKERIAVEAFYEKRNFAPVWFDAERPNARAKGAIARMQASAADGLVPTDYRIPETAVSGPQAVAEAELRLTAVMIAFTRHLQAGRFPFSRMGGEIMLPQEPPNVVAALTKLAEAADIADAIDQFSPPQAGYHRLKAKLAELRGATGEEAKVVRIPEGPGLRPGMEDARVPLLRQRLKVDGDETNLRYDDALVTAVKAYQKANKMKADGTIGAATVRSLNAVAAPKRSDVIDTVIANMERWRWLPRDLGKAHVILNIPNYTLRVMRNGEQLWTTRVVVGKPSTATPLLTETMKYITVNPTWNVPPSIVRNEYLPALAQDPGVLERMGLKVVNNRDGSVHVYQPPGEKNALGRLRFNFPNPFLVYQHDTPDKHLFAHDRRAYSHGCMRVQDPAQYAEVLLSIALPDAGYTKQRIMSMFGPKEQDIKFPTPIPVHITYQTAFVDDAGELQVRPDIYGIDTKTRNLIRSERAVVEPINERPSVVASTTSTQRARPKEQPRTASNFFEALFGGGQPEPQAKGRKSQPKNQARQQQQRPPWEIFGQN